VSRKTRPVRCRDDEATCRTCSRRPLPDTRLIVDALLDLLSA
jgi:hypothetical protein